MNRTVSALALVAALACIAVPVSAQSKGDVTLGLGLHGVFPEDDNGVLTGPIPLDVDESVRPTITVEYFIADNLGIELLASWPFEHDLNQVGVGKIGETKHLPPTLSLQYHFVNNSPLTPFIGAGVNYTYFFDENTVGLGGTSIDLDDSWGLALHAGLDFEISESGSIRTDVRWIDIDSDVTLGGASVGSADIDPWVFGVAYVHKF